MFESKATGKFTGPDRRPILPCRCAISRRATCCRRGDPEYYYTLHLDAFSGRQDTLATQTFRIGQEWKWWPKAEKLHDNRLKPLENRSFSLGFTIPYKDRNVRFQTRLVSHRMSKKNANFNQLLQRYPLSAQIFQKEILLLK